MDSTPYSTRAVRSGMAANSTSRRFSSGSAIAPASPSLKVGYNKVFGYYIEVTHAHSAKVPADFERRQTLATAERYVTLELKQYEAKVLGAEERMAEREAELFGGVAQSGRGGDRPDPGRPPGSWRTWTSGPPSPRRRWPIGMCGRWSGTASRSSSPDRAIR